MCAKIQSIPMLFVAFLVSCFQPASAPSGTHQAPQVATSCQPFSQFWSDFKTALGKNDVSRITMMTRFPLDVDLVRVDGFEDIENQQGFARHFKTLFPDAAVRGLLKNSPRKTVVENDLSGTAVESWSVQHDEPNHVSEAEWSIIYVFSRLTDGKIRMTSIHFAG